jgi:hypothetical protein
LRGQIKGFIFKPFVHSLCLPDVELKNGVVVCARKEADGQRELSDLVGFIGINRLIRGEAQSEGEIRANAEGNRLVLGHLKEVFVEKMQRVCAEGFKSETLYHHCVALIKNLLSDISLPNKRLQLKNSQRSTVLFNINRKKQVFARRLFFEGSLIEYDRGFEGVYVCLKKVIEESLNEVGTRPHLNYVWVEDHLFSQ